MCEYVSENVSNCQRLNFKTERFEITMMMMMMMMMIDDDYDNNQQSNSKSL